MRQEGCHEQERRRGYEMRDPRSLPLGSLSSLSFCRAPSWWRHPFTFSVECSSPCVATLLRPPGSWFLSAKYSFSLLPVKETGPCVVHSVALSVICVSSLSFLFLSFFLAAFIFFLLTFFFISCSHFFLLLQHSFLFFFSAAFFCACRLYMFWALGMQSQFNGLVSWAAPLGTLLRLQAPVCLAKIGGFGRIRLMPRWPPLSRGVILVSGCEQPSTPLKTPLQAMRTYKTTHCLVHHRCAQYIFSVEKGMSLGEHPYFILILSQYGLKHTRRSFGAILDLSIIQRRLVRGYELCNTMPQASLAISVPCPLMSYQ